MEGIHLVDGVNANVFLVIDGEELTVIDTGMPRNASRILGYVRELGRQPSDISRILLTHCHIDHVGSVHDLKKLTNAKVAIHQEDAEYVAGTKTYPRPKGVTGTLFKAASPFFKFKSVQPDIILKENDKVGKLTVIHTPGHTPRSISLYDSEREVLFVGDAVRFTEGRIIGPPERFTPDMKKAVQSIGKISQLEFDVMLSGHGEPLKPNASDRIKEFYVSLK
jgi:glyoxylase-like metal-dependent hydrolase (beta-lactamase superfamily II)